MKKIICLLFLMCITCNTEDSVNWTKTAYVDGFPIHSSITQEEVEAVSKVSYALFCLGYSPPNIGIIFVRTAFQDIPEVCQSFGNSCQDIFRDNCVSRWIDLHKIIGTEPKNPSEGYKGFCGDHFVFIRRYGDAEKSLMPLLRHEITHALGYDHGPSMKAFEQKFQKYIDNPCDMELRSLEKSFPYWVWDDWYDRKYNWHEPDDDV